MWDRVVTSRVQKGVDGYSGEGWRGVRWVRVVTNKAVTSSVEQGGEEWSGEGW